MLLQCFLRYRLGSSTCEAGEPCGGRGQGRNKVCHAWLCTGLGTLGQPSPFGPAWCMLMEGVCTPSHSATGSRAALYTALYTTRLT